jgi:drug/metabolite transporter (DMT)-like permease
MQLPQGFERLPYQALVENIVTTVSLLALLVWGITLVNAALKRRQQMQMQKHLLEKFASAHDFAEFLQSPAGQKYVLSLSDTSSTPRNSILSSLRLGIVLLLVGPAVIVIPVQTAQTGHITEGLGMVLTMLGVGFLVSAIVSYFIAKKIKSEQAE